VVVTPASLRAAIEEVASRDPVLAGLVRAIVFQQLAGSARAGDLRPRPDSRRRQA
jgi:hypothetical protein